MTIIHDREKIQKITKLLIENDDFLLECDYVISSYIHYCANNPKVLLNITINDRIFTKNCS
jgi:hypothetical protein